MRLIPRTLLACALACAFAAQPALAQEKANAAPAAAQTTTPAPTATPAPKPAAPSGPQKLVTQGLEVELTIEPVASAGAGKAELMEAEDALVRVRVTDTATGSPITGVRPSV